MLTLGTLRRSAGALQSLAGADVLVTAASGGEVLIDKASVVRPPASSATMVFMHETIAMMKAERAAQLEHLRRVVSDASVVIPIAKKAETFWDNITLGRASTADIVLEDPAVSNMHAELLLNVDEKPVSVQDVGSSNGTFLNREPLHPHQVRPLVTGDCLRFGQTVVYYVASGALEEFLQGAKGR